MEEYWDLYDEHRKPLGRSVRRGWMSSDDNAFHVVVMIATMDAHGRLLCTLRSPEKHTYPGVWEITAGSALSGEDSLSAAVRELREETGITAAPGELRFIKTVRETTAFIDCYFLRRDMDIGDIVLQKGETVSAKWVNKAEFENMIAQKKLAFPVARRYGELYDFLMQEGFI